MESAVVHKKFIPICNVSLLPSNLFFVHAQVDEGKYTGKMYYLVYILFPEKKLTYLSWSLSIGTM
jgi:hypothetical protein